MRIFLVRIITVVLLAGFGSLASGAEVNAQVASGTITGTVQDQSAGLQPLSSVQVTLPELGLGGLTRANGRYLLLNIPVGVHEVQAQRIGYASVTAQVTVTSGGTAVMDFEMSTQALGLDAIVVTGTAGGVRQREIGNSIETLDLTDSPTVSAARSMDDLLSGQTPGLLITLGSGQVGDGAGIRLRGNSSRSLSNQPLIYVDGVRVRSEGYPDNRPIIEPNYYGTYAAPTPLNDINPNDIERIEVIKGPAATTLYGAEAATGVIQIFTKRGVAGRPVVEATIETGIVQKKRNGPLVGLRGEDLEDYFESKSAAGGDIIYQFLDPWMRDGVQQKYAVSIRGSSNPITYFVAATVEDDQGLFTTETDKGYNLRANLGVQLTDYLDLQFNTAFNHKDLTNLGCGDNVEALCSWSMYEGMQETPKEGFLDALVYDRTDRTAIDRLITGGTLNFTPIDNFTSRLTVGYDRASLFGVTALDRGHPLRAGGKRGTLNSLFELVTVDQVNTYQLESIPGIGGLAMDVSVGFQSITKNNHVVGAFSQYFAGPGKALLGSGSQTLATESMSRVITGGGFAQAVLKYSDKYFVTVGLRIDGNSVFGQNFGWASYPKISGSWVVSDEGFWSDSWGTMRIRSAWGKAGRAPGAFAATRTWNPVQWAGQSAFSTGNSGNPDLGPETTTEIEAGFEASILDDRLSVDFTWFSQRTTDALVSVSTAPSEGSWGGQTTNLGVFENKGIELGIDATLIRSAGLTWDVGAAISTLQSEAVDLGDPDANIYGGSAGRVITGSPVPVIRGDLILNPNAIGVPAEYEKNHLFGPNYPTLVFAPSMNITFAGGVSLSMRGEYRGGAYIRNDSGRWTVLIGSTDYGPCIPAQRMIDAGQFDQMTAIERATCWQNELNAKTQAFVNPTDFFKLREVSLRIPLDFVVPERYSATLTFSGANIWRWVKPCGNGTMGSGTADCFREFDPEQQRFNELTTQIWAQPSPPRMLTTSLRLRL